MRDPLFFLREAAKGLSLHPGANIVSVICIALALLSLTLVVAGGTNLDHALEVTRGEAEIVVYLAEDIGLDEARALGTRLVEESGARHHNVVTPEETVDRIEALLGSDFDILEILEGFNPFTMSLEVSVDADEAALVAARARTLPGVEVVRDNEEILAPLAALANVARWLGLVASVAVAAITLILVSHIVRLGISARREEIETLRLLGASEWFVSIPFLLEGAILGGLGASACLLTLFFGGPVAYGALRTAMPFMPLVPWDHLLTGLISVTAGLGLVSGTLGAAVALRSR